MTYTYQVTEVHLLKNSSRTVATRTALLDRVPNGDANVGTNIDMGAYIDERETKRIVLPYTLH